MKKNYYILVFIFLSLFIQNSQAQMEKYHKIFILNFVRYIEWPGLENQLTFKIAIVGENHPLTAELKDAVKDFTMSGKPVDVVEFKSMDDFTACHILFVPTNRIASLRKASRTLAGISVLIVTEMNGFSPKESAINIMVENDGKMVFTINPKEAKDRGLKISKSLLDMAKK